jgi:hypothetical protein
VSSDTRPKHDSRAARFTSVTIQKMIASTSTGTVSLVRVRSATNWAVRSLVSINAMTLSRIGTIQNGPGPLTARNLPACMTTACSHCRAIS